MDIGVPVIGGDIAAELLAWAVGMVSIGINGLFIVANAVVVIWFVRKCVRWVFGSVGSSSGSPKMRGYGHAGWVNTPSGYEAREEKAARQYHQQRYKRELMAKHGHKMKRR